MCWEDEKEKVLWNVEGSGRVCESGADRGYPPISRVVGRCRGGGGTVWDWLYLFVAAPGWRA